ncbi:MAG: cobalamin biosynthesis protein CobD [Rhodospirillales bacterium CG15_BIG_FIL_POST_REV_8_21_14_020_66_15]|nr:MAG: cobalamin biosynthesis protein CobD [Rhodospirillales bacterium CG15_BIG_FIL_POST_REV_8_21_14_020_66_15]
MLLLGYIGGGQAAFDPLILLLLALLLDAYLGDTPWLFKRAKHPVALLGDLIDWLDRKLNRDKRPEMDRAVRGAIAVLAVVALTGVLGLGVAWLSLAHPLGWVVELFCLVLLLAQRGLYDHVRAVRAGLNESLDAGRRAVSHIVGRDPDQLDNHGVARAAIESAAENFGDGVVAPVFYYVLFGAPGLFVYKAVNTMDSMIGHRTPRHRAFGMTAARLDDVLNLIPARLSGLFICLGAAFAPGGRPLRAVKVMLRDAGKHRSMNAGWPEGAMAGALGLALAGPRRYAQDVARDPWIGDGTAQATAADIGRALYLYAVACLINAGWVAAVATVRFSLPPG